MPRLTLVNSLVSCGRVCRGGVGGRLVGRGVGSWLVIVSLGITFVFDIGGISVTVGSVGDDLSASVGESDAI